ncbi:hypothetical protein [Levilactobacillus sp. HBUAS70063]|uniref:hypothetical protein n=1 Tax=Levilactobacillus sp. HBUAS70063 TaxID=3109359 RepID=UPI003133022A
MTKIKTMMTKVMLGAMTVTTLLATSAGASAATVTTTTAAPTIRTTVQLNSRPVADIQVTKIHLKPVTTKKISSQVQTAVDASALNLDQKHSDSQLK